MPRANLSNHGFVLRGHGNYEVGVTWREEGTWEMNPWEYLVPPYCFSHSLLPVSHDVSPSVSFFNTTILCLTVDPELMEPSYEL